jgi:diacylglycerol kinase family enzyme
VVFVNPGSGSGTDLDALRRAFDGHDVIECEPDAFDEAIRRSLEGTTPPFLAMAGGDGSMRTLAARLAGTDAVMLTVPEGTRNHLAQDLGIATLDDAVSASTSGSIACIDLGWVNGEVFVNTLSLGTYPAMVRDRERRTGRWPKPIANLLAALHQTRKGQRSTVELDGERRLVWSVFVGNGRYGTGLADLTSREDLTDGLLDVRVVRADAPLGRTRVLLAALFGRLEGSPLVERTRVASLVLDVPTPTCDVALDGEVLRLATPLEVSCRARSLRVLVPPDPPHESADPG